MTVMAALDLLTVGRVGVDIYPLQTGPLKDVSTFQKFLGGTATNVAVGAARLGHRTAVVTKVGPDGFGDYVREALTGFGVDASYVGTAPDLLNRGVILEHQVNPFGAANRVGRGWRDAGAECFEPAGLLERAVPDGDLVSSLLRGCDEGAAASVSIPADCQGSPESFRHSDCYSRRQ